MARHIVGSRLDAGEVLGINQNFEFTYTAAERMLAFLDGTGTVGSAMIAEGSIDGTKIADSTIFSNHMRLGAIGERELATGGVASSKIRNDAVNETKIQDGAVTRSKISNASVDETKLADLSVTNPKIGLRAVDTSKLDYDSVTLDRIADYSISAPKILNGAVFRSKLDDAFMFNERVITSVGMSTLFKDGTYIVDSGNIDTYPTTDLSGYVCVLQVERMEGWVHQTISRLQSPDVSYKRWVGTSSGTVSDWKKVHIGDIDGGNIADGTVSRSKVEDGAISSVKILDGAGFRRKLADDFMYGGRIETTTSMESVFNDGTYIVDANNAGVYPNQLLAGVNCAFKIESYQSGWIHQTISPLTAPEKKFVRWVGKASGTVSEWQKVITGEVTGNDIKNGSIPLEKLSGNIDLPNKKTLKILMIGNSYAVDTTAYLHEICASMGIDAKIGILFEAGANLQTHYENHTGNVAAYRYDELISEGGVATKNTKWDYTITDGVAEHPEWDYITFQQASADSDDYTTYQPYLNDLISEVKGMITYEPRIGLLQTWAWATSRRTDQVTMYEGLVDAYDQAMLGADIGALIPVGTAIQTARGNASLNSVDDELTRDGTHLGVLGSFIAGQTMFSALFEEYYSKDAFTESEYKPVEVTNYQSYKAKLSAKNANISPLNVVKI